MNKYHIVNEFGRAGKIVTELSFEKGAFSYKTALELANRMNAAAAATNSFWGRFFVVPAPFAGVI